MNRAWANQIALKFWWRKYVARITKAFWVARAKKDAEYLLPYLPEGGRIIDIGAGSGTVSLVLSEKARAHFTLADVIDWNVTQLPLVLFDGEHLPFADKEFDAAMLVDVLHHSEKERQLMQEALRVAKRVVVLEVVLENPLIQLWEDVFDNLQWLLYGMPVGIHHRNKKQWVEFLKVFSPRVQYFQAFGRHSIFVVE